MTLATRRTERLVRKTAHDLEPGDPVRVRPDPTGNAWIWQAVRGLRCSVVEVFGAYVKVRVRRPKRAAGRELTISPLLLMKLPTKRRRAA